MNCVKNLSHLNKLISIVGIAAVVFFCVNMIPNQTSTPDLITVENSFTTTEIEIFELSTLNEDITEDSTVKNTIKNMEDIIVEKSVEDFILKNKTIVINGGGSVIISNNKDW